MKRSFLYFAFGLQTFAAGITPASYSYDALDRLTQVNYGDGKQINYTYDEMNNITSIKTRNASPPVVIVGQSVAGTIGIALTDYVVQVNTTTGVLGYTATGLPAGLKFNAGIVMNTDGKLPGTIYGKPTVGGLFKVTLTARNITGTSTPAILTMNIANPFIAKEDGYTLAGTVNNVFGFIPSSVIAGDELGGEISLKVTTTGAFTGTLKLGLKSYPITGQFDPLTGVANAITIVRTGIGNLTLHLTLGLSGASRGSLTGSLDDTFMNTVTFDASTNVWSATHKASVFSGATSTRYNVGLPLSAAQVGVTSLPQGSGYCSITVGTTGVATIAGVLADGTAFTKAPVVWEDGSVPVYLLLYASKGYIVGTMTLHSGLDLISIADNSVDGSLTWLRPAITGQIYPAGFSATINATGGAYIAPATGYRSFELGNAVTHATINLTLSKAWLGGDIAAALTISTANLVTAITPNNNSHSLVLTKSTGTFTGKFTVTTPTRIVSHKGMIVPAVGINTAMGYGFFMMPQTVSTSSQLSGNVLIARP